MNRLFGLIGYPLGHSWSKRYFMQKFHDASITDARYELFPISHVSELDALLISQSEIVGLNVTIPHKTSVIPFLTHLDPVARAVNAVNTIKVSRIGNRIETIGFNTDVAGFQYSIEPLLRSNHKAAMILGTGGAAKAAAWVFNKLGIDFVFVSRHPNGDQQIGYSDLAGDIFEKTTIIVNATPLGMEPDIDLIPPIPFEFVSPHHLLFDMIYNPELTVFLKQGMQQGATIKNGLEMLQLQAEKSWQIWNS